MLVIVIKKCLPPPLSRLEILASSIKYDRNCHIVGSFSSVNSINSSLTSDGQS